MLDKNCNSYIVCSILKKVLFNKQIDIPKDIDWEMVYQEMKEQTVAAIPYKWILDTSLIDAELKKKWFKTITVQVGIWMRLMNEQEYLIQLMEKNKIKMAILKGSAVAVYYPQPMYRTVGDVDFLVKAEDFQRAYQLMLDHGFKLLYDEDHVDYHITLQRNGVCFEIHKRPGGLPEKNNEYLFELIQSGLDHVKVDRVEDYEVPILPRLQNGLVLLLHVVKHLESGIGLRQILDWMMFVDKNLDDSVWIGEFQPILQKIGLEKFAITMTRMCQLLLGLRSEGITWCRDVEDIVCEELLAYIMEKGNFGRKIGKKDIGVRVLSRNKSILRFIIDLQKRGYHNWKFAQKHPIMYPLAWSYQLGRYIGFALTRDMPLQSLKKDFLESKQRKKLIQELAIFETQD